MSLLTTLNSADALESLVRRPSLEVWLDAIASPMTVDGSGNISQWSDLSGKGNHALQVSSDPMPVYQANKDGFPAVYSNGDDGRKLDFTHAVTNNDPFTAMVLFAADPGVTDPSTGSSLNVVFGFGGADTSDNSIALRQGSSDAETLSFVAYSHGSVVDSSPISGFECHSIRYDGSDVAMHYGLTQDSSGGTAGGTRVFGTGRLFNEVPENTARTGVGWMRGFLLFKEALAGTERDAIVTALKARYGLSAA